MKAPKIKLKDFNPEVLSYFNNLSIGDQRTFLSLLSKEQKKLHYFIKCKPVADTVLAIFETCKKFRIKYTANRKNNWVKFRFNSEGDRNIAWLECSFRGNTIREDEKEV